MHTIQFTQGHMTHPLINQNVHNIYSCFQNSYSSAVQSAPDSYREAKLIPQQQPAQAQGGSNMREKETEKRKRNKERERAGEKEREREKEDEGMTEET